jgi:hypothetical protein
VRCEQCGSEDLSYERDALLLATPLRLEGDVLILDGAPRPAPLEEVVVSCCGCGHEQAGIGRLCWRPEHAPLEEEPLEAEEALDLIAAYINVRSEVQGADFVEFVSKVLPRSGREVVDGDG